MNHQVRISMGALLFVAVAATSVSAQEDNKKIPVAESKVPARIGFISNDPAEGRGRYKIGMWTPVYVKIKAGPQGIRPKGPNDPEPYIQVENEDNEDVGTIYRTPFRMEPNEERWVMSYAKPGKMSDIKIKVVIGDLELRPLLTSFNSLELNTHLYVSLGDRVPDLQTVLASMSPRKQQNLGGPQGFAETWPRYAGYETDPEQLPDNWFGYHGVDLLFLSTRNNKFLEELGKDNDASRARLRAIAQYVRRGGRLIISVSTRNADLLNQLLNSTVWQPALPVVPPKEGVFEAKKLVSIEQYAGVQGQAPFHGPHKLAVLESAKMIPGAWEVLAAVPDEANQGVNKPVMVRMPYGLGSITLLAFPLDEQPFTTWQGKSKFLEQIVNRLGPRAPGHQADQGFHQRGGSDLSTDLQRQLDNFDVRVIPFGYVALFIVLYILIVGPLDFVLLKYVFKRLEWTWFTFPTVVLAVSVAAYFTAYAIKGSELKINKVDLVDFDLRTNIDAKGRTKKASVYGHTFFTILSPQIKNYTIGVEPNPLFWGQNADKPVSADMVTWLGRAEQDMFGGMGARGSGQGFFRKPYRYEADAVGLLDVPIPVWTTKSFHAAYEMPNLAPPVQVDLTYFQQLEQGKDLRLAGTIKNGLAVDLDDVWLIYMSKAYPIGGGLPKGADIKINLEGEGKAIRDDWAISNRDGNRLQTAQGLYNPSPLMRQIQFHERVDHANTIRNHALRALDLCWRLQEPDRGVRDNRILEALLVARVKFATGSAEALTADVDNPLPTNLWLHDLPGPNRVRPRLDGVMAQDTFVRMILPVKPKE